MESNPEVDLINERLKSSWKKKVDVEKDILSREVFTPQEAAELGLKQAFFTHEYFYALLDIDAIGAVNWAKKTGAKVTKLDSTSNFEEIVEETAKVISGVMTGDYLPLKQFLNKRKKGATQNDPLCIKVMQMVDVIPDEGAKLKPPLPSTMDSATA